MRWLTTAIPSVLGVLLHWCIADAEVTVGRVGINLGSSELPFPITSGRRLRREIETLLSDKDDLTPLVFQAINLPRIDNVSIDDVPSSYGSLLSIRESDSKSMSGFVTYTIFDTLNKLMGTEEDSDFDTGSIVDAPVPIVAVITDVPNLVTAAMELERLTSNPSPLQQRLIEIQHTLLSDIANLDAVSPPSSWQASDLDGADECSKLVMAEGRAVESLASAFAEGLLQNEAGPSRTVIVVVLTQGISCYADEANKEAILKAIELLDIKAPEKSLRAIVPTETWAPFEVVVALAKSSVGQPWRRRLQALPEVQDLPPDMWPLRQGQEEQIVFAAPKSARAASDTDPTSYVYAERRLIFTGVAIVLSVGALVAVYATAYMPLNKDPLLYTKINTNA